MQTATSHILQILVSMLHPVLCASHADFIAFNFFCVPETGRREQGQGSAGRVDFCSCLRRNAGKALGQLRNV